MSDLRSNQDTDKIVSYRPSFILYIILTCGVCAALPALPAMNLILVTIWGALVIMAGVNFRAIRLLSIAAINGAALFWQAGLEGILFYGISFGLPIYAMGLLTSMGKNYYQVRTAGFMAAAFSITIYLGSMYYSQGGIGTLELAAELNGAFQESLKGTDAQKLLDMYAQQGVSRQEIEGNFERLAQSMARHLPAIYYLQVIVAVFFMLLIASNMSLRRNKERLKRRPFFMEMMPWPMAWLVIAGLAAWLWGYNDRNSFYYMGSNILVIMVPITFYYGLAALIFKLKEMSTAVRRWVILSFIITTMVFPPSTIIFLSLAGLFDSLLDFRKVRFRREEI